MMKIKMKRGPMTTYLPLSSLYIYTWPYKTSVNLFTYNLCKEIFYYENV
jgi:hypothetical protein